MKIKTLFLLLPSLVIFLFLACGSDKSDRKPKRSKSAYKPVTPKKKKTVKTSEEIAAEHLMAITPQQMEEANNIVASVSEAQINAVDAKNIYKKYCVACHGANGKLQVNGAKDLTISTISLNESVAQIYFGKGLMTPFKGVLKNEEIVAVAQYIEKELRIK